MCVGDEPGVANDVRLDRARVNRGDADVLVGKLGAQRFAEASHLVEGNHRLVEKFRHQEAIKKTLANRPELLENLELDEDKDFLNRLKEENDERNEE